MKSQAVGMSKISSHSLNYTYSLPKMVSGVGATRTTHMYFYLLMPNGPLHF